MTRSYKANKQEPKSSSILTSSNLIRVKKDGAGKFSWGNHHDQLSFKIEEGIREFNQASFSSSPPNGNHSIQKIISIDQPDR